MRWLRQGLTLLLAVGAVAAGGLFSLQNTQEIPLDLIVVQLPAQPVAIWILAALAAGVVCHPQELVVVGGTAVEFQLDAPDFEGT